MRLLFICGSLEPGKDGVGDYILKLASELIRKGASVEILAINDKYISGAVQEIQATSSHGIQATRIGFKSSPTGALSASMALIERFKPDWISLQYVPYAFHKKGIPLRLASFLAKLGSNANWHLMFHETYLDRRSGVKNWIIGKGQIVAMKRLKALRPKSIHTSIPEYKSLLSRIGYQAELLGLFGNIDVEKPHIPHTRESGILRGVFFGASPKQQNIARFAERISSFTRGASTKVEIVFCGRSGYPIRHLIDEIIRTADVGMLKVDEKGALSANEISQIFAHADFGMARVGPDLLGKSGAAIAMLEHGLPLFVPLAKSDEEIRESFDFRNEQCFASLHSIFNLQGKFEPKSRTPEIAQKLLNSFSLSP